MRVEAHDVPAILGLKNVPLSERVREQRVAKTGAKRRLDARDRAPQNRAGRLLESRRLTLRLDVGELPTCGRLVRRRRQIEADPLRLIEALVILLEPRT